MAWRGRGDWRWFAAALLISVLVLGLGFVLRASGLGPAANVAQLVSLAPLVVGLANWPRAGRAADDPGTGSLARLGEHLRTVAYAQGLTGRDLRDRLPGWDGETVDAFLNGTRRPGWDFVVAFLDAVARDEPWRRELMEQRLRPVWVEAGSPGLRDAVNAKDSIRPAGESAGIEVEQLTTRRITLWGPRASGKSTFIAALNFALSKASPPWTLTGANEGSMQALISYTKDLAGHRRFPQATSSLETYRFVLSGMLRMRMRGRIRPRIRQIMMRVPLSIVDVPGEAYHHTRLWQSVLTERLVSALRECDGIIFFFDPASEATRGDAYDNFYAIAAFLEQQTGSRLPQHVAVCIAKFDHPAVFSAALESGYLAVGKNDPHRFPVVPDNRAAAFFDDLYRKFHPEGVPLRKTIERYFYADRIRYFVVSSTGFYLDQSGRFDPDDYYNLVTGKPDMVRGDVYPANLLEPLLWLTAPDSYDDTARLRRDKYAPYARSAARGPLTGKEAVTATAAAPGPVSPEGASHLICLLEGGADDETMEDRLAALRQLTSVAVEANRDLRLSLVTYGTHSVARGFCEEPTTVWFWATDSTVMAERLDDASHHGPRSLSPRGRGRGGAYRQAAQIECALAEVARRLTGTTETVTVITVGASPPFPSRMLSDSEILPCPARNDWKAIIAELQGRGVILGAIHDQAYEYDRAGLPAREVDEIWARLGSRANATLGEVDVLRFAGAVGLLSPDRNKPYPPDWHLSRTSTWHGEEPSQAANEMNDDLRPYRLNDDLRGLLDARLYDKYEQRPGGRDQLYGEDDL